MSNEALRAVALAEAGKLGSKTAADVLTNANIYLKFLIGETVAPQVAQPAAEPAKATDKTPPAKATPAKAPVKSAPPAKKLVPEKSEEEQAAEAVTTPETDPDEIDWSGEAGKKAVGEIVAKLIAANQRPAAIKLLADYKASSVSGVKSDDREQFVADGTSLLNDADITS